MSEIELSVFILFIIIIIYNSVKYDSRRQVHEVKYLNEHIHIFLVYFALTLSIIGVDIKFSGNKWFEKIQNDSIFQTQYILVIWLGVIVVKHIYNQHYKNKNE